MDKDLFKVVVGGPFASGKTTFVTSATSAPALRSERTVSDATSALKAHTTTAMDHGSVELDDARVTLFGTPGQERFSFMWPVLAQGMHGYVLLVDASRLQARAQLRSIVRAFRSFAPGVPYVIAANRWDPAEIAARDLAAFVDAGEAPVVACDPREEQDCRRVLEGLIATVRSGAVA